MNVNDSFVFIIRKIGRGKLSFNNKGLFLIAHKAVIKCEVIYKCIVIWKDMITRYEVHGNIYFVKTKVIK